MTREDRIRQQASTKMLLQCLIGIIVVTLGAVVIRDWRATGAFIGGSAVGWLFLHVIQREDEEHSLRKEEERATAAEMERDDWKRRATDAEENGQNAVALLKTTEALAWMCRAAELEVALEEAITQCSAHNADYHHQTPGETLDRWSKLVAPERRDELIEKVYHSET